MNVEELEPEMEELVLRYEPELVGQWKGATNDQIDQIETIVRKISGNDLPKFYRWFLMRMGKSMAQLYIPDMDYSAPTVLSWYGENFKDDGTKFFKIGHASEEMMELHMYYDFKYPAREDARLARRAAEGGDDYPAFESFREMLAISVINYRAIRCPHFCNGTIRDNTGGGIMPTLDLAMDNLGLKKLAIPAGPRCGLYEGSQAYLKVSTAPNLVTHVCGITIGCIHLNFLRTILNTIDEETNLKISIKNDPRRLRGSIS